MAHGRPTDARTQAEAVLSEAGVPEELRERAEATRLRALVAEGDLARVRRAAVTILGDADRCTGHVVLSGALTALGWIAWNAARIADATGLLRAAAHQSSVAGERTGGIDPKLDLAFMLAAVGDFEEADAILATTTGSAVSSLVRARLGLAAGRLDDAVTGALAVLGDQREDEGSVFPSVALTVLAEVALLRGDTDIAANFARRLEPAYLPANAGFASALAPWLAGRLAAARQDPAHVVDVLGAVYDDPPRHRRLLVEQPAAAPWLVRVATAAGADRRAAGVVAYTELLAGDNRECRSLVAAATHARGVVDGDVSMLERAGAGHRHPWAQASAFEDAGALVAGRDTHRARVDLERARVGYEQMGAHRDAARVRRRLHHLERAGASHGRGGRPLWGWDSLTPTETRVAALVAGGLTNRTVAERMYLSRHTVDFHLRQIFRKLDVTSRVALTRVVLDHDGR